MMGTAEYSPRGRPLSKSLSCMLGEACLHPRMVADDQLGLSGMRFIEAKHKYRGRKMVELYQRLNIIH